MVSWKVISTVGLALVVLGGCSSTKEDIIPKSDKTTEQVYDEQVASQDASDKFRYGVTMRPTSDNETLTRPYDINKVGRPVFKTLPNPTLYLYFPASMSSDGRMPIPAWMTQFKMYDRDEFAGHGELRMETQAQ